MKTSAWIAVLVLSIPALGQGPFPLSVPVAAGLASYPPSSSAAADFNEDGREDLAVGGWYPPVCALTVPGGVFGPYVSVVPVYVANSSIVDAAVDLTADGHADILCSETSWSTGAATPLLYPGSGAGQFGTAVTLPDPSTPSASYRSFVNLALPGAPAAGPAIALCAVHPTQVHVFTLVRQSGAWTVAGSLVTSAPPPLGPGTAFQFSRAGDVNGDGLLDLVGGGWSPGWQWSWILLLGTSAPPYFAPPVLVPSQYGIASGFELADVDHDGLDDVIARRPGALITTGFPSIDLVVFHGHPVTPFTATTVSTTGAALTLFTTIGDFDGDENLDLLASVDPPPGTTPGWKVGFCRGDGHGHFGAALVLQGFPSTSSQRLAAADVDGDGMKDAVGIQGSPPFVLFNQARIGPGLPGPSGIPQTTAGLATPGNPVYHVGVIGGTPNAPAILGVSAGMSPSSPVIDPATLILPTAQFGTFSTDALGAAAWWLSLPPAPALLGQTVYLQWAVIDAAAIYGYSLTPARKIVFW